MMNGNMRNTEKNANTWSRFQETIRKAGSRRSRSGLDFYTRSAVPALLTLQSSLKEEQL